MDTASTLALMVHGAQRSTVRALLIDVGGVIIGHHPKDNRRRAA